VTKFAFGTKSEVNVAEGTLSVMLDVPEQWSLVMTASPVPRSQWARLEEALPSLFGRRGLDVFTLCFSRDALPAELADGLPRRRALQIADDLEAMGVRVEVIPTDQAGHVRYRAAEVWASHVTERFTFKEVDGMIFAAPAVNARRNLAVLRSVHPDWRSWQFERGANHGHADASRTELSARERVRAEAGLGRQYEEALRAVYPQTRFILSHLQGDSVTFYQAHAAVPSEGSISKGVLWEKVWCERCHHQQPYRLRDAPDAEFPQALWGDCLVCGGEVLVSGGEVLRIIAAVPL